MLSDFIYQSTLIQEAMSFTDMLEITDGNNENVYIGFAQTGTTDITEAKYAICRIQKNTVTGFTSTMWAEGTKKQQFAFADCETYTYKRLR